MNSEIRSFRDSIDISFSDLQSKYNNLLKELINENEISELRKIFDIKKEKLQYGEKLRRTDYTKYVKICLANITRSDCHKEIKNYYKKYSLKFHPDKGGTKESFQELQCLYFSKLGVGSEIKDEEIEKMFKIIKWTIRGETCVFFNCLTNVIIIEVDLNKVIKETVISENKSRLKLPRVVLLKKRLDQWARSNIYSIYLLTN